MRSLTRTGRALAGFVIAAMLAGCSVSVTGTAALPNTALPNTALPNTALPNTALPNTVDSTPAATSSRPTAPTATHPTSTRPTPTPTPTRTSPTTLSLADLRDQHDAVLDAVLTNLTLELLRNNKNGYLKYFAERLDQRVGSWFANTRLLGVSQAHLVRMPGYYSQQNDKSTTFSRNVVIGIRTPYDDDDSMPGITYTVSMSRTSTGWQITNWKPSYVDDPMNCDCTLTVTHNATMAVVSGGQDDLQGWPRIVLDNGTAGVGWARQQLQGSDLVIPKGQVIFLADAPYRWFLDTGRPAQRSNATISLVDASGAYPGQDYSAESRIVVILADSAGDIAPQDARGALYVADVVTHESTHQLMSRNSNLYYSGSSPIETWMVEGIAVAVEVLHRRDDPESDNVDYPQPDDPRNADVQWLIDHVDGTMPTQAQLYGAGLAEQNYWYGVAGSVFLYLQKQYDYRTMMKVAALVYAKNNQTPFQYFPDPDHPGTFLPQATAKARWLQWFKDRYET